jgi:prolyl oligopeptidase
VELPVPARFNADDLVVSQHFATSADGTRIPYFLVAHGDSTGPGPTLLYGYGGFAQSQLPGYLSVMGRLCGWSVAEHMRWPISGAAASTGRTGISSPSGRAGTRWPRTWPPWLAISSTAGVTTAPQLGASGASAGGLLMGVMLTQYPELFGALVCRQALLDMRRFPALGAGAGFLVEYGNPDDPADWEFIKLYSPYHNIRADRTYPPILITTSTNDDRVHPGHARKMAAVLQDAGHRVLFYENTEGGHAGVANNVQAAFEAGLMYEFLHSTLSP